MNWLIVFALVLRVFHISEGKPCPEETRPHKSRCDSYFRCVILPSKSHVWVPTTCERGLIYEPNLRLCVLPGDDWECTLGDLTPSRLDANNIFGVNSLQIRPASQNLDESNEHKIYLVEDIKGSDSGEDAEYIEVNSVSGGASNKSSVVASDKQNTEDHLEFSGDGSLEEANNIFEHIELKDGGLEITEASKVDPKLSAHLQRLSQLIDGLKKKYKTQQDEKTDLRPDQLNAFLAHYNIRSQFDALNPSVFDKRPVPQDGRIEPDILQHILTKQQKLQSAGLQSNISLSLSSLTDNYINSQTMKPPPSYNNHQIFVHNTAPEKHYRKPDRYSNSQIVANKPDGSFVLTMPPNQKYKTRPKPDDDDEPRISEETLKTILELSKQMIANQNIRQVLDPNNAVYHPLVQPMYEYVRVPMINPHPGNIYLDKYLPQSGYENEDKFQKIPTSSYTNTELKKKPPVNVNSVLPITFTSGSESGNIPRPIHSAGSGRPSAADNSVYYQSHSNDKVDSYGNSVLNDYNTENQNDRDRFPPYDGSSNAHSQNDLYSTTLQPPLNFNAVSHVTPPEYNNFNSASNANGNSIYNRPSPQVPPPLSLPYPSDPNIIQEAPKPIMQLFSAQQPLYDRPSVPQNSRPLTLQSSDSSPYSNFEASPSPPHLRPIKTSSVNIRPNSIQTSASGASMTSAESVNDILHSPESQFNYQQTNVNSQIVSDMLASNLDHSYDSDRNQLVNLGGNFISYDVYKNQILPAIAGNGATHGGHKVEVISCTAGVRQPNSTDCTKYYVCSKKDGKVLSYSCPPYTGFNPQTHICDAKTYAFCNPQAIYSRYTVSENRQIQMDAIQALEDAKKVRDQAIQAQNLANFIRLETQKVINNTIIPQPQKMQESSMLANYLQSMQRPSMKSSLAEMAMAQTTVKPHHLKSVSTSTTTKRKRIRCIDGAKVPDPESVLTYYVCFKGSDGKLRKRKMSCSPALMFCNQTNLCTLPRKCNA